MSISCYFPCSTRTILYKICNLTFHLSPVGGRESNFWNCATQLFPVGKPLNHFSSFFFPPTMIPGSVLPPASPGLANLSVAPAEFLQSHFRWCEHPVLRHQLGLKWFERCKRNTTHSRKHIHLASTAFARPTPPTRINLRRMCQRASETINTTCSWYSRHAAHTAESGENLRVATKRCTSFCVFNFNYFSREKLSYEKVCFA